MNENDRIPVTELSEHPFIAEELIYTPLSPLDIEAFNQDMAQSNKHYSGLSSVGNSLMTNRFGEGEIKDTDVVLTTKASEQVRIILSQLVNSAGFSACDFDMGNSTYFNKHYDVSMQKPYQVSEGHLSVAEDIKENHFDSNGVGASLVEIQGKNPD